MDTVRTSFLIITLLLEIGLALRYYRDNSVEGEMAKNYRCMNQLFEGGAPPKLSLNIKSDFATVGEEKATPWIPLGRLYALCVSVSSQYSY